MIRSHGAQMRGGHGRVGHPTFTFSAAAPAVGGGCPYSFAFTHGMPPRRYSARRPATFGSAGLRLEVAFAGRGGGALVAFAIAGTRVA